MNEEDDIKPITREEIERVSLEMERNPKHRYLIEVGDECYARFLKMANDDPAQVKNTIERFLEAFTNLSIPIWS